MAKAKAASAKRSEVTANVEVVPGKKSPLKKFKQVGNKDSFKILEGFGGESPTGRAVVFSIVCDEKGDLTGDIVIWQSVTVKRDQDSGQLEISGKPKLVKASKDDKTERTDVIGDLNVTVQFPSGPASMSISSVAYGP